MKKLLPYFALLKPVRLHFIGALLCGVLYGVSSGFGLPFVISKVFPHIFGENPPSGMVLFSAVAFLPVIFAIRGLSGFFNTYLISYCGIRILEDIRLAVFSKLQHLPLLYFQKNNRGDILSRTVNDTRELQDAVTRIANDMLKEPITFIGAMGALVYMSMRQHEMVFVLFSILVVPICVLPIRFIGRKLYVRARKMQAELGAVTEYVSENLGAIREVRAFNLQERQIERFRITMHGFFRMQMKVVKYTKALTPVIEFIAAIGVAIAIFYAAKVRVGMEDVAALFAALYMSYDPIKKIGALHNLGKKGIASLNRLEEILDTPVDIADKPDALKLDAVEGRFQFQNVSFDYGEGTVLHDINCDLEARRVYALVGPSGAGKSTFINLMFRFYDVTSGAILLDGHDLRNIQLHSLRSHLALVAQDPILFNDSIYNNILLSRPEASREEVVEAAHKAYAHHFIEEFENGYDTVVGEKGTRLSGGQRQRIALARAFLKDAPVLVLDEATSALDSESESKIQLALQNLIQDKTVFIIAHRFSTIQMVDNILVFEDGRLVDQGSHDYLHANCDFYRKVYDKQLA